jgi:hypothetical protein
MAADSLLCRQHKEIAERDASASALYSLAELPRRPWMPRKNGKHISRFTCIRWALHGKRGIKLRTTMVGGLRCTCDDWAWDFFERLNGDEATTGMRRRQAKDHNLAEAELTAEGIC